MAHMFTSQEIQESQQEIVTSGSGENLFHPLLYIMDHNVHPVRDDVFFLDSGLCW